MRRAIMGLATVLGVARRGYFIPYRYASDVPAQAGGYPGLERILDGCRETFVDWLSVVDAHAGELRAIDGSGRDRARWDQDWFPRLDAAIAYATIRRLAPRLVIEVGSGHSTRFMARAIADGRLSTELLAIDPAPRAAIEALPVTLARTTLQQADRILFARLRPGDLLCMDSSHILMPGTDVDIMINDILPSLPPGVVVFFHDIFLPDPYPADWAWRGYNEQSGVSALMQGGYVPLFASRYVVTRMAAELEATVVAGLPLVRGAHESGLWLVKT
jgi:hypothetical protein